MRFMPVVYVREGAKLGKHIYDDDGRILLKKGATLTKKILNRINEMGIRSVYIDDEFSDTELEDIIKPELRNKAISAVKETFAHFEKFSRYISENPMQNKHQIKKLRLFLQKFFLKIVDIHLFFDLTFLFDVYFALDFRLYI